ncbi:MAG: hypothetical protein ACFFAO_04675, partial [Candidatus Hermodarchaeota archaeon]
INFERFRVKINELKTQFKRDNKIEIETLRKLIKRLKSIVQREIISKLYYIVGGHGGIIVNNIGFCEFDDPEYAMINLIERMKLAIEMDIPYNLEIAMSCLEWFKINYPKKFSQFRKMFKLGRFNIINPTYSQPYNLIIGSESNIKQIEYGLKTLKKLGLDCNIYYSSEASLHPQIPQILEGFNINYCSLRTRLLGTCPTSHSGFISWIGLDGTKIPTICDQSGIYNGEFFHGTFYREVPNLLFQAVSRPFIKHIIFSSIEDFIMPLPFQEDIWRITRISEVFGKFVSYSDLFKLIEPDGEFKYKRDNFSLGEYIFVQNELFLNNKECEVALLTVEILNCIIAQFNAGSNDDLLDQLWKKLLITQAHDCYAVSFVQPGDYAAQQLSKEEYEKLKISSEKISISELCFKIQKEILQSCIDFNNDALNKLAQCLTKPIVHKTKNKIDLLVFNPTIFRRKDKVSIPLKLEDDSNIALLNENGNILNYVYDDSKINFIANIPPMGYKIFSLNEQSEKEINPDINYLYDLKILEGNQTIQISFNNKIVYELTFGTSSDYVLTLIDHIQNTFEDKYKIQAEIKNKIFTLEIFQYNGVNRLEFNLLSELLNEVILNPTFPIIKSLINYPFGIEETKRSQIQTLDFLWLMGEELSIFYVQKNSQQFIIDRNNFQIRNLIKNKGRYEFSISIYKNLSLNSAYQVVDTYKFNFLGIKIQNNNEYSKKTDSFLSINPSIKLINLWSRDGNSFLRILNSSDNQIKIKIDGPLIKKQFREINFNNDSLNTSKKKVFIVGAWKIQSLSF